MFKCVSFIMKRRVVINKHLIFLQEPKSRGKLWRSSLVKIALKDHIKVALFVEAANIIKIIMVVSKKLRE